MLSYKREEAWPGENAFLEFIEGGKYDEQTSLLIRDAFSHSYNTDHWRGVLQWLTALTFG